MARLIDADAIQYTHAIARCIEDGHNWNELCVTKDDIDAAPTVPAIPVEWLREKTRETLMINERNRIPETIEFLLSEWLHESGADNA